MKICALSDLHGQLNVNVPECELVLIAGDIIPLNIQFNMPVSECWWNETFRKWAEALPCDKVLFIAGNHDIYCERNPDKMRSMFPSYDKITYLQNELYEMIARDGMVYSIFGSPYCKIFGSWAFMREPARLDKKFKKIPAGLDILLTHDAPYGCSDVVLQKDMWWATDDHIGNPSLSKYILERKPKYNIHGHLHSASHFKEMLGDTEVYCVAILDEHYVESYIPLEFNYEKVSISEPVQCAEEA